MTEEPKLEGLKITDRRQFDATGARRAEANASPGPQAETGPGKTQPAPPEAPSEKRDTAPGPPREEVRAPSSLADIAMGLSSSFSLLIARLAQETEIYLGLVPYPGKDNPEPDLEAARAMIDMLSMLQEKTRGNLDPEESQLLENLLYSYRLEFVRLRSGGEAR